MSLKRKIRERSEDEGSEQRMRNVSDMRKLRVRAEKLMKSGSTRDITLMSGDEIKHLMHELDAHQIELEIQNDELRKIQEDLIKSRDQYTELYDLAPVGYVTINEKSLILQANLTLAKMLGVSKKYLEKKPLSAYIAMEDQDVYYMHIRKVLHTQEKQSCELRLRAQDGVLFWVGLDSVSVKSSDSEYGRIRSTLNDITERKRMETELQRKKSILTQAEHVTGTGSWEWDMTTRKFYFSDEWRRIHGVEVESLTQGELMSIVHPDDRDFVHKAFWASIHDAVPYNIEHRIIRRNDKKERLVKVRGIVEFAEDGTIGKAFGTTQDVTDIRAGERERMILEARLREAQKLESIGTMANGVAHEINNPINGIMNYAQLIIDRLSSEHDVAEFAGQIINESERVANIISSLLAFSRREPQGHSLARVSDIVEKTLSLVRSVLHHDKIMLNVDINEKLPKISCHSQQIQQVIMNLITNARDALNKKYPKGGGDKKKISITANSFEEDEGRWVRITVADSGPGLSDQTCERMFDPFFTTKPRNQGTGLGLSISHGIVKDHGGELIVESEEGKGTRVHVDLPITNDARSANNQ